MRVLLVSPGFHGYHAAIAAALAARGHIVSIHVYDDHGGILGRTSYQLLHELPRKFGAGSLRRLAKEQTARAAGAVERLRPEALVIVKGDSLGRRFWDALDGLPRITWLYDELRRTQWSTDRLADIGPVATYSSEDAVALHSSGLDAHYLPLAYDHRLVDAPTMLRTPQVSFVGARYPSREEVLTTLRSRGVPVCAYGRDWSGHPIDRLRTWRISTPDVPAERDLSRARAYDVMASSAATLNLHGDQDGLTVRTFEASGVGGVQLIDRADVGALYDPGTEILPWATHDELVELCRRSLADLAWSDTIRAAARARTLAHHTFDHRIAVLESAWDRPTR